MKKIVLLWGLGAAVITATLAAQAQVPGVNSTLQSMFNLVYEASTSKPTYSATRAFSPVAQATDVCVLAGSSTKTIRVRRILFSGINSPVATDPIIIAKRSTAATTGTSVVLSAVPYDSGSAAASAQAEIFTANPTVGTLVGVLAEPLYLFGTNTTATGPSRVLEVKFGEFGSPVFLRGAAQNIAVNLAGLTYNGTVTCTFEWTEDNDS